MFAADPNDEYRKELLRRKEAWVREHEEALASKVPISDDVSDEDYAAMLDGSYLELQRAKLEKELPAKSRPHITIHEAAWVLGHKDAQSLSRMARLGYPQRQHYSLPWPREDHYRVLFRIGHRWFVDFHYWDRRKLTEAQRERLEAIEFEPDD